MDWLEEWWNATLADDGFWLREQPADHFRTSLGRAGDRTLTTEFVDLLLGAAAPPLPERRTGLATLRAALAGVRGVVDLGAGDGTLLHELATRRPGWMLHGVDVRPRPDGLPAAVGWTTARWDVRSERWTGIEDTPTVRPWPGPPRPLLVLAHEWLDDLPCRVACRDPDGWQLLGPDGPTGRVPAAEELAWLATWAGDVTVAEIGLTRDRAWARVAAALSPGSVLLAVDYGHLRATRPADGALTGYRHGRCVAPVPDGRTNITAAVAVDALAVATESVPGLRRVLVARQADVVREATQGPAGESVGASGLQRLVAANRRRVLADPARSGANWWVAHRVCGPSA